MYPQRQYPDDPNSIVQWRLESFETADAHVHRRPGAAQLPWWSWLVPLLIGLAAVTVVAFWPAPAGGVEPTNFPHHPDTTAELHRLRDDALARAQTARSLNFQEGAQS